MTSERADSFSDVQCIGLRFQPYRNAAFGCISDLERRYKSLKLNQRNIFDLIPDMTVIFSDDDFTTTAHSEAAYLAWIRVLC